MVIGRLADPMSMAGGTILVLIPAALRAMNLFLDLQNAERTSSGLTQYYVAAFDWVSLAALFVAAGALWAARYVVKDRRAGAVDQPLASRRRLHRVVLRLEPG